MVANNKKLILDEEQLNRRVLHRQDFLVFDENIDEWTVGNAALVFDPDLSVYLSSEMEQLGLQVSSVLNYYKKAVVFSILASQVRELDFRVESTPLFDSNELLDRAHGSVWKDPGWNKTEFRRRRNQIRLRFSHVAGEITL